MRTSLKELTQIDNTGILYWHARAERAEAERDAMRAENERKRGEMCESCIAHRELWQQAASDVPSWRYPGVPVFEIDALRESRARLVRVVREWHEHYQYVMDRNTSLEAERDAMRAVVDAVRRVRIDETGTMIHEVWRTLDALDKLNEAH